MRNPKNFSPFTFQFLSLKSRNCLIGNGQVATCLEVEESLESSDVILHQREVLVMDRRADLHNGNECDEWEW